MQASGVYQRMLAAIEAVPLPTIFQAQLRATLPHPDPSSPLVNLTWWAGRVVQTQTEAEELVTAALLLARLASSILDDIQDADTDDALWRQIGAEQAMNVSVALAFAGQAALDDLLSVGIPASTVVRCQGRYAQVIMQMCGGQFQELAATTTQIPTLEDYFAIVEAKTASFCAFGCRLAALVAGGTDPVAKALGNFGHQVGILHQVYNDYAALHGWQGKKDLGKRWTFSTLYALTVAPAAERTILVDAWRAGEHIAIREQVVKLGAPHYLLLLIDHHIRQARAILQSLEGDATALTALHMLIDRFQYRIRLE